jgi:putative transposase
MRSLVDAAIRRRRPPPGLIFHSDRGSEFLRAPYRQRLTRARIRQSMCRYVRYYNHLRLHSALNYQSPVDYERRAA